MNLLLPHTELNKTLILIYDGNLEKFEQLEHFTLDP